MPQLKNPFVKGSLYIEFDVQFPDASQIKQIKQALSGLLPGPVEPRANVDAKEVEEVVLTNVNMETERRKFEDQRGEDTEEDDNPRTTARCQPQ